MDDQIRVKSHNPINQPQTSSLTPSTSSVTAPPLRMIAWELTRSCNLSCVHCRASAEYGPYEGELATQEVLRVMDEIASFSKPVIILTGGEPLLRSDIFELASYGTAAGFRMVMATNGTLLNEEVIQKMKTSGIQRISVSIDGPTPETHDAFRKVKGSFEGSLRGIEMARRGGLEFQINTTITQVNLQQIPAILRLAVDLGAAALHIFLLVPTGRGKELKDQEISAQDYEKTLHWFYEQADQVPLQFRKVCGGCRARAYELSGEYMAEEPYCVYEPVSTRGDHGDDSSR